MGREQVAQRQPRATPRGGTRFGRADLGAERNGGEATRGGLHTPLLGKERPGAVSTCENRLSAVGTVPGNRGPGLCMCHRQCTRVPPRLLSGLSGLWVWRLSGRSPAISARAASSTTALREAASPILPRGPRGPLASIVLGLTFEMTCSGSKNAVSGAGRGRKARNHSSSVLG